MTVKKVKNIALTIKLVAFGIGFSDAGESIFWFMGRPAGAILFCVFLILTLLEKEMALLDQELRAEQEEMEKSLRSTARLHKNSYKEHGAPVLTTAILH